MDAYFEIIIPEFGEVLDENWEAEEERVRQHYLKRLSTYSRGHIDAKVETRNIGRGADWIVVVISLASAVATGFVAIPKAHKLIRESVEEWQRIFNELKALFGWLAPRRALYPDNFLFLTALSYLDEIKEANKLVFQGFTRLPEDNPDLQGYEPLLFTFTDRGALEQVAVARNGEVLWHSSLELSNVEA